MAITPGQLDDSIYKSQMLKKGRMGFSGCDVTAMIRLPAYKSGTKTFNQEKVFQIGTLQTISISTYNAKSPVKAVGFKNPVAIARGGRTIAGTLIFNQLHYHVFDENNWPSMTSVLDEGLLTYSAGSVDYVLPKAKFVRDENAPKEQTAELEKEFLDGLVIREKLKKQWDFSWDTSLMGDRMKPSDMPPFDIVILMVNELGQVGKIILYGVEIVHDSQTLSVEDIYTEAQYQYIARDIEYFHSANFEEASAWKAAAPDYKIVKAKEVTGEDKVAETPIAWQRFDTSAMTLADDNFVRDQILNADEEAVITRWQSYKLSPQPLPEIDLFYNNLENPRYDPNMPLYTGFKPTPTGLPQLDLMYNDLENPTIVGEKAALDKIKDEIRAKGFEPPPDWVLRMQGGR
jgi:hypothetical protein